MMRSFAALRVAEAFLLALSLGACAVMNREVRLTYPPPGGGAETVATAPIGPAVSVAVTDVRQGSRYEVGTVRNGFYMHTADVTTTDDVAAWVRTALEQELGAAGFRVVPRGQGAAALDARVVRLECDAYFTYSAEVELSTRLTGASPGAAGETVTGEGGAGMNWTATEASFGESLSLALQDAARKVAEKTKLAVFGGATAGP